MIDFMSGRDIDVQALLRMVGYAEDARELDMGLHFDRSTIDRSVDGMPSPCGTAG